MEWQESYSAAYRMYVVDAVTWKDTDELQFLSGTVEHDMDEDLMESADFSMDNRPGDGECWVRVYLEARQERHTAERAALFTGLTSAPARDIDGNRESYKVECYSVLKPAADVLLERGWYAPTGIAGAVLVKRLLSVCPCPISCEDGSPELSAAIVAEDGETRLSMARKILDGINWRIKIDGRGEVCVCPNETEPVQTFDAVHNDCIENAVTDENDWYSCPNVFRAVSDDMVAISRDESGGKLSVGSRGREIWLEETDVSLSDGETLAAYAQRRLKEEQAAAREVSYDRRFIPDIYVSDYVKLHYPKHGFDGSGQVKSQSITLGYGCTVSEVVNMVGS